MTELISRQAALAEIDKNREALLQSGMTGAEHILVHYGRRVIEELPTAEPKRGKWILCSERLPEVNERCLCTYEFSEGTCVDFGLYTKRGWFVSGVTAWMPLPEPYKTKRSEG